MLTKEKQQNRSEQQIISIEDLVPEDHILRAIDKAIDFSFIYKAVEHLYCMVKGRPSIDPVVLFKIILIQYIFGIRSMRQTIKEIQVNMAYRWFLGYGMTEKIPHFTTFGKNYVRRFAGSNIFEQIFEQILQEAVKCGFIDAEAVFQDSTHVKASANKKKSVNEAVKTEAKHYHEELMKEVNADREAHGKKRLKEKDDDGNDSGKATKNIKVSTTDPESGLFHKGEHEKMFAYTVHAVSDKNGFVLASDVSPGNVHDSVMFDGLYKHVTEQFPEVKMVALDSAYKTPWIMKQVFDSGRIASAPYKRPMTKEGFFKKYEYVYDEYHDCVICPENHILKYSTTNREGYREYKSNPKTCQHCPSRHKCTESKNHTKVVTLHIWADYMEKAEDVRHSPEGKEIYAKRKETIERVFADAKERHAMRYAHYRGIAKLKMQALLTFAAMNLKKLALWKKRKGMLDIFPHAFLSLMHIYHFFLAQFKTNPRSASRRGLLSSV